MENCRERGEEGDFCLRPGSKLAFTDMPGCKFPVKGTLGTIYSDMKIVRGDFFHYNEMVSVDAYHQWIVSQIGPSTRYRKTKVPRVSCNGSFFSVWRNAWNHQ